MKRALKASLGRLELPKVDLYQMHWPFPPVRIETWMEAMAEVCQAGFDPGRRGVELRPRSDPAGIR